MKNQKLKIIEIQSLTVTKTKNNQYNIHVTINGKNYKKKVNEYVYSQYQKNIYNPSQFVCLFAPELIIHNQYL